MKLMIHEPQHAVILRNRLKELYRKKTFCDLHLRSSDGTTFFTHKLVLATYSNYFKKFASRRKPSQHTGADVVNLDIESNILSVLLNYVYKGEFEILPGAMVSVRKAAKLLELQDILQLVDKKREQIRHNLDNQNNTSSTLNKKKKQNHTGEKQQTLRRSIRRSELKRSENERVVTASQITFGSSDLPSDDVLPEPEIEMDVCEEEEEQEHLEESKEELLKQLHLSNSDNSNWNLQVTEELEAKFRPPVTKTEFTGLVQSLVEASSVRNLSAHEASWKESYSGEAEFFTTWDDNGSDGDGCDPNDEIFIPDKPKSYQKSAQQVSQCAVKKKPRRRKLVNLKNLHVFRKRKYNHMHSRNTVSKQILKKYYPYLKIRYVLATSSLDSNTHSEVDEFLIEVSRSQKRHKCKICGQNFKLKSIYRSHIIQTHLARKRKPKEVKSEKAVIKPDRELRSRIHEKDNSAKGRPTSSDDLDADPVMKTKSRSSRTLKPYSEKKSCPECKTVVANRRALVTHLIAVHKLSEEEANHHRSVLVHCDVKDCAFTSMQTIDVERHVKMDHPEVYHKCPHCNYTFYLTSMLDKHMHLKHLNPDKLRFACSVCGRRFHKSRFMKTHQQAKHGIDHGLNKHRCPEEGCSFATATRTSLKMHANVHKEKLFTCPYCSMKLKTEISQQRHINKIHLGIRPFLCQMCGQSFGDVHNLRTHISNRHTDDKEYKCPHCPYMTSNKAQHSMHVYLKHGEKIDNRKEFACPYCPYKALMKSRLAFHVKKHTNTRDYACDECGKTFTGCDTLRAHKEWLHSSTQYSCTYCNYVTKTDKRLQEHISIQHRFKGMKPYQCPYCPFTCATGGNTRKHVMKRHPGLEVKFVKNHEMINYMKEVKKKEASDTMSKTPERLNVLV